ncbi:MAG: LysR family transcriptional regulator [Amphritea sp.]
MHAVVLSYLDQVARQGSIRKAAKILNVSSSAVNRQVLKLEEEFGIRIFDRVPDGVVLTEAGRAIVEHCRRTLHDYEELRATVDDIRDLRTGHIVISTLDALTFDFLPSVLGKFTNEYPNISYTVRLTGLDEAIEDVAKGDADIGIGFSRISYPDVRTVIEKQTPFGVITLPNHPLADRSDVTLQECLKFSLIRTCDARGRTSIIDQEVDPSEVPLSTVFYTNSLMMAKQAILANRGIGFYTKIGFLREIEAGELKFIPLAESSLMSYKIGAFISSIKYLDTATRILMNFIVREFRSVDYT